MCKINKVVSIFKNETRSHYALPISLLCNIGKIIEKLIFLRLNLFLETRNCYYPFEFVFRLNFSTNNIRMSNAGKIFKLSLIIKNTQLVYLLTSKKTLLTITYYLRNQTIIMSEELQMNGLHYTEKTGKNSFQLLIISQVFR